MFDLLKSKVREFTVYAAARTILFAFFFFSSVLSRITTKRFELLLRGIRVVVMFFFFLVCLLQKLLKVHLPCHIVVVHETPT